MTLISRCSLALLFSSLAGVVLAADNPLSVHVLNLENGLPSSEVRVTLEQLQPTGWQALGEGVTNQQGRIPELYPADQPLQSGTYKVTFKTGDWFAQQQAQTFFLKSQSSSRLMAKLSTTTFRCCSAPMDTQPTGATESYRRACSK